MTPVRTSAIFSLSKNTINHAVTTVFINARYTKAQLPVALVYNFHFFLNWDSLFARLNSHYEAWTYKKKKRKAHRKSV